MNDAQFLEQKSTGVTDIWGVSSKEVQLQIIKALDDIKILDPACGSGAFPIGMMQLIVQTYERVGAIYDRESGLHRQIKGGELFEKYQTKLSIIRNNLYGSDIEPMAIEIARLRTWLSLIIEDMSHIDPLPNLDFNFVCANSLVPLELEEQISIFDDSDYEERLAILRDTFFATHNISQKLELKEQFEQLYSEKINNSQENSKRINQLGSWNPFDASRPSDFFDSKIMFNVSGFDIVIGNPPYNAKLMDVEVKSYKKEYKSVLKGRVDTAALFVELATRLTKNRFNVNYILPYRLITRERNHGAFIEFIINSIGLYKIIYLGIDAGFEHVKDEFMILSLKEFSEKQKVQICNRAKIKGLNHLHYEEVEQKTYIDLNRINLNSSKFNKEILKKIEEGNKRLEYYCEVKDGIIPFIREKLISNSKKDSRYVKFAGISGTYKMDKFYFDSQELYLCYDLEEAKKYIKNDAEIRKVQLRNPDIFEQKEKIITSQNSIYIKGTIDKEKLYHSNSLHSTYLKDSFKDSIDLKLILACMNSLVLNYYHDSMRLKGKDLHPQILVNNLKKLPIPDFSQKNEIFTSLSKLVDKIIFESKYGSGLYFKHIEEIEERIFLIYSLDNSEILEIKDYFNKSNNL
jgi:hypothetical protein